MWVGNADYTPMFNTSGLSGAAPIWSQFMETAVPYISGGSPTPFSRPAGIVDKIICTISGTEPSNWCREQRNEIFAADQPPLPAGKDLYRKTTLDTWTGLEASNACKDFTDEQTVINTGGDPWAEEWLQTRAGKDWLEAHSLPRDIVFAPQRECNNNDPQPTIEFRGWKDGEILTEYVVDVRAVIDAPDGIKRWTLEYGLGEDPDQWTQIAEGRDPVENPTTLLNWDLQEQNVGGDTITLRIYAIGEKGYAERKITLRLQLPTPTPSPTFTPTATLPPLPTDTPTPTSTSTTIPVPTGTPTATLPPTNTPFPSATTVP